MCLLVLLFFEEIRGCRCKIDITKFGMDAENSCCIKKIKIMGQNMEKNKLRIRC